jgi:hypothetical protein
MKRNYAKRMIIRDGLGEGARNDQQKRGKYQTFPHILCLKIDLKDTLYLDNIKEPRTKTRKFFDPGEMK